MDAINDLAEELKRLNRRWMESYVSRDTAFLEQYLADDSKFEEPHYAKHHDISLVQ
jgi:hypothetical protein